MGAVALGQQLNSRNRSAKAVPPRQFKDTTRTRYNAIRHGILARCAVLPGEDPQQYEDLRTALARDLGIVGILEEIWLDQLVSCYWRMQRILRAEAEPEAKLELLHRYEVGLRNEMKGLIAEIREAQLIRRRAYPTDADDVARRERRERSAARHETSFWESVQQDMDGPPPPPAPTPPRGAGEGTRSVSVSPAVRPVELPRGAAVPAAIPPPAPSRGAGEGTRGAGEGTRGAGVSPAVRPVELPRGAAVPAAIPPPAPSRGAGEGTRGAGVSPAVRPVELPRGAAVPAAIPPPAPSRGAGEGTPGAGEGTRGAGVSPAVPPVELPRGAAVPAAIPPSEPPADEAPISDAAVRFAIESRENPTLARLADSTTVRAYVGDRLGLMSRNEGV